MADLGTGVGRFVAALSGGRGNARRNAEKDAWEAGKSEAEAKIKADEFMQREPLGQALVELGIPSGQALSTVMRGGFANFPQGTEGISDLADMAIQRQVLSAIESGNPDVAKINQLLAARKTGGGALTPQEASVVPLGQAMVERTQAQAQANQARAGASGAQALASQALADLRGRTDPNKEPAKVAERKWLVEGIESDIGRKLTAQELADLAMNKLDIKVPVGQPEQAVAATASPLASLFSDVTSTSSVASEEIPPQARALLKEGQVQIFGNGQGWTLQNGKPVRVK